MQQEPKAINFGGVLSMTGQIWTQKVVCVVLGITSNDFFEIWYNINSLNLEKPDRAQVWEKKVLEWVVFTPIWAQMLTCFLLGVPFKGFS